MEQRTQRELRIRKTIVVQTYAVYIRGWEKTVWDSKNDSGAPMNRVKPSSGIPSEGEKRDRKGIVEIFTLPSKK